MEQHKTPITLKSVQDFILGNMRYYTNKVISAPKFRREEILYRLYLCKDDCLVNNKCKYCGCPPNKKAWLESSCNDNKRFGPLHSDKVSWEKFKAENKDFPWQVLDEFDPDEIQKTQKSNGENEGV